MSNLPPGVTDAMCEPFDPMCGCGHYYSDHNEDETCDMYANIKKKEACTCKKFEEGDFEPEPDEDRMKGIT